MATNSFIDNIIIKEKDLLAIKKAKKTPNKLDSIHVDFKDVTNKEEIEKKFKNFLKKYVQKINYMIYNNHQI